MAKRGYHHGDLRRALLAVAAEAIAESGPAALSLRDLARRAGVSHAAPTHHFGDKAGLLTALATEGYELLAAALTAAREETGSFLEVGVAYVGFAVAHRAHFEVMFRPDLYHADDPELVAARARAGRALYAGVTELPDGTRFPGPAPADGAPPVSPVSSAAPASPAENARPAVDPEAGLPPDVRAAGLAAWSIAHGFATLWLSGALADPGGSPEEAARAVLRQLNPG
jgi:AcrR family transcriptional regulator